MSSISDPAALDAADPLAGYRARFTLPPGIIYLDGNSLGPLPAATPAILADVVARQWGDGLIRSWNDAGWIDLPVTLGARIAPLVGAAPDCVVACDSVSVNIFKLAGAALALRPGRRTILCEADDFPTDRYVLDGLARLAGARLKLVARADIAAALDDDTALILLCHAHYATGAVHDMAAISALARIGDRLAPQDLARQVACGVARHRCRNALDDRIGGIEPVIGQQDGIARGLLGDLPRHRGIEEGRVDQHMVAGEGRGIVGQRGR